MAGFALAEHTSYPTRTTLGGEDGQIQQGDDVVCPPALEPVSSRELKRMRFDSERRESAIHAVEGARGHIGSEAGMAASMTAVESNSPDAPSPLVTVDTQAEVSLQKMSIATLLGSEPSSSSAPPPPLAEASSLSINNIINAPGNDDNILEAEDFFSLALSADTTAADTALGSIEPQPEDEEVLRFAAQLHQATDD
jgi:hypothetical protein